MDKTVRWLDSLSICFGIESPPYIDGFMANTSQ